MRPMVTPVGVFTFRVVLPPVRWLGPSVYRFIARHRYSLPGAPARCESDTCTMIEHSPAKSPPSPLK